MMAAAASGGNLLDPRRKRARFRAWHRGTREMDLILGPFADTALAEMSDSDLEEFERLLEISDTDLLKWFTGAEQVPESRDSKLFRAIGRHREGARNRQ